MVHQAPLTGSGSTNTWCDKDDFVSYVKANDAVMRNMKTKSKLAKSNDQFKGLHAFLMREFQYRFYFRTHDSYYSSSPPKVVEGETVVTKDMVPIPITEAPKTANSGCPSSTSISYQILSTLLLPVSGSDANLNIVNSYLRDEMMKGLCEKANDSN
ncbi:hypothetical protein Tco_0984408 [Tanacetum coccineum]